MTKYMLVIMMRSFVQDVRSGDLAVIAAFFK
jgi:hypothetical protein